MRLGAKVAALAAALLTGVAFAQEPAGRGAHEGHGQHEPHGAHDRQGERGHHDAHGAHGHAGQHDGHGSPGARSQRKDHGAHHAHGRHGEHEHHHPSSADGTPTQSEREHVPPAPPTQSLPDMSYASMVAMMDMDDRAPCSDAMLDQLDWRSGEHDDFLAWDVKAWYGTDYHKAWFRSEGEHADGSTEARAELLWDRIISRWWSLQAGLRHDFNDGPSRDWLAIGVQGLAPYFFEVEATAYLGESGRTALRLHAEYDLLFTQRLILQPTFEVDAYGKDDLANGIASGLSEAELGLRLRYEIRRTIAPYVGIAWVRHLGDTADLLRANGEDVSDFQVLAGIRLRF